jgi:hypothetical protein
MQQEPDLDLLKGLVFHLFGWLRIVFSLFFISYCTLGLVALKSPSLKVEVKTVILANKERKVQVARFGDLEWEGPCILAIIRHEQIQISQLFYRIRFSGVGKGGKGGRQTSAIPPQESTPVGRGN